MSEVISYKIEIDQSSLKKAKVDAASVTKPGQEAKKAERAEAQAQKKAERDAKLFARFQIQQAQKARQQEQKENNLFARHLIQEKFKVQQNQQRNEQRYQNNKDRAALSAHKAEERAQTKLIKDAERAEAQAQRKRAIYQKNVASAAFSAAGTLGGIATGSFRGVRRGFRGVGPGSLIGSLGLGLAGGQLISRAGQGIAGIEQAIGAAVIGDPSKAIKGLLHSVGGFGSALVGGAGSIIGGAIGGVGGTLLGGIGGLATGALGGLGIIGSGAKLGAIALGGLGGTIGLAGGPGGAIAGTAIGAGVGGLAGGALAVPGAIASTAAGGVGGALAGGFAGAGLGIGVGSLLGVVVKKLTDEVSKIIDVLDSMVQEFAKFNPALAAMVAVFQVRTIQFDVIMGNLTKPITTAWMQIKTDFLGSIIGLTKVLTPLIDLFGNLLNKLDGFIRKVDTFFGISPDQFVGGGALVFGKNVGSGTPADTTPTSDQSTIYTEFLAKLTDLAKTYWDWMVQESLAFWNFLEANFLVVAERLWNDVFDWIKDKLNAVFFYLAAGMSSVMNAVLDIVNSVLSLIPGSSPIAPGGITIPLPSFGNGGAPTSQPSFVPIQNVPLPDFSTTQPTTQPATPTGSFINSLGANAVLPGTGTGDTHVGHGNGQVGQGNGQVGQGNGQVGHGNGQVGHGNGQAKLPQLDGGINQTINMNLQAKVAHEQAVRDAIYLVQSKLLDTLNYTKNETMLLAGIVSGHGEAMNF